ncbi:MAG TPA: heparinase II/III family protein, partial [Candidatus Sulfotelmatobacter sp.]|nr:heparinase II/III family protein [Candidatus Sulfotelmatobacter sp.]
WSDDDGGWHEGVSYWSGYMGKAVTWLQFAKSALDIDGLQKPFFAQVGDFPLYVTPPGSPNSGFGDLSYRPPSAGVGGFMEYFVRAKGCQPSGQSAAYWRWWTESWHMRQESGVLGFLYHANLPEMPPAKPPTDLPQSKVFHGIGVASLHTTLLDAKDDVHLLFKSSPLGSQSHGHNPQNTFQLNAFGESLITPCVYRDLHGSKFHYQWVHSTEAQNGVLVNGQGQIKHAAGPLGRIADARLTDRYDYLLGDATPAYEGRLQRAHRHVAFVKPDVIVLYDDLVAAQPATFQFMLHALQPFTVDEPQASLSVQQPKAGLTVNFLSPVPIAFRQWDGFTPKPTKEFPNQWHVEAGTREKRTELGMLTVLVPYRAGQVQPWKAQRLETATALGVRFERAGQMTLIAFRKAGVAGQAELAGQTFAESVKIVRGTAEK